MPKVSGKSQAVVSFSGDPTFTSQNLASLLSRYKGKKIDIVLDASKFQTPDYSPNMMIDDVGSNYSPPLSSMIIDENLISIVANPSMVGQLAHVAVDPEYPFVSDVITNTDESCVKARWERDVIKVNGNINVQDEVFEREVSPKDLDPYILDKLEAVKKTLGISGKVKIVRDAVKLPGNLMLVDSVESKPLKEIIQEALKQSNNLVFDSLYLTIVNSQKNEAIQNWSEGYIVIKDLVKKHFDVDMQNALIVDGSGISRYNRLMPLSLFQILQKGYEDKDFLASLAQPGEEGSTMEKRAILGSNIRAKTGSMSSISCLCGYKIGTNPKAFVVVANSFAPPSVKMSEVIDEFIKSRVGK